jgi:quinol monooxygenase YgiN
VIDLVCTQRIKPGAATRVEELLREAERLTLANDAGCERYEWYRGNQPDTYVLIERWRDGEAAQRHLNAPHMVRILKELAELVPERFLVNRLVRLTS